MTSKKHHFVQRSSKCRMSIEKWAEFVYSSKSDIDTKMKAAVEIARQLNSLVEIISSSKCSIWDDSKEIYFSYLPGIIA